MKRRVVISLLSALALSAFVGITPVAAAASFEETAKTFVDELASQAIHELTDKSVPRAERIKRFRAFFNAHFAVKGIGKWILGRHWRKATQAEQEEYLDLFEDLIIVSYVDRFAAYVGEPLHVHKTLVLNENNATVYSDIHQGGGMETLDVNWRVARKDGVHKIVDVVVEGTSMSSTLRSDFSSIIRQRGGKVSGLIEALREKTASLSGNTH